MKTLTTTVGTTYTLSAQLGQGGEGTVYALREARDKVAKIYHPARRTAERENKLQAMIANPPTLATIAKKDSQHLAAAWPQELVYANGTFVGFTMPRVTTGTDLYKLLNPKLRRKHFAGFDWRHQHRVARNLAVAIRTLHEKGHVIGDLNQKNAIVSPKGLVTLVDCDSYQIASAGELHTCAVGVADYLPPELQGQAIEHVTRTQAHDLFALGVLIFQLLMEGYHPFTGVPLDQAVSIPGKVDLYCIREGIFPYLPNASVSQPPHAPSFHTLHPALQALFQRCFVDGHHTPSARPTTAEWMVGLDTAAQGLRECHRTTAHWYLETAQDCPWCTPADIAQYQQRLQRRLQEQSMPTQMPAPRPFNKVGRGKRHKRGGNWFWLIWVAFMFGGEIFSFIADLF